MKYSEGKLKLRSHNTCCCLIEVVAKAGLIALIFNEFKVKNPLASRNSTGS